MSANDRQVGGEHYKKYGGLQHWDVVVKFGLDYFQGQITKYVMRWKDKGGVQDLKKAAHFLEKYIEQAEELEIIDHVCGEGTAPRSQPKTTTEAPQADSAKRGAVPPTAGMGAVQPIAEITSRFCACEQVDMRSSRDHWDERSPLTENLIRHEPPPYHCHRL